MLKGMLRFKAMIQGREAGVVAAITPPIDVPEMFWNAGAGACARDD